MANRYSLLYRGTGGRFYGLTADVRIAAIRILDALRILDPVNFPDYLRDLDVLNDKDLEESYPDGHEIWKLDLSCFACIDLAELDLRELGKLLARCIDINFKYFRHYVRRDGPPIRNSTPLLLSDGDPWRFIKRALYAMETYSHEAISVIPVPGWGKRCLEGWLEASECQRRERQLLGTQDASYLRLHVTEPALLAETCVKGGVRVKI